jgi:hypothetical protein
MAAAVEIEKTQAKLILGWQSGRCRKEINLSSPPAVEDTICGKRFSKSNSLKLSKKILYAWHGDFYQTSYRSSVQETSFNALLSPYRHADFFRPMGKLYGIAGSLSILTESVNTLRYPSPYSTYFASILPSMMGPKSPSLIGSDEEIEADLREVSNTAHVGECLTLV